MSAERIKEEQDYEDVRMKFLARFENARIPIFRSMLLGDAVIPGWLDYPPLLSMPAPRILDYPMAAVVAEELEALRSIVG